MLQTKPRGSVWTPKLDGTEVLYAPLWRPAFDTGGQTLDPTPKPAMNVDGNDLLSNATADFRNGDSVGCAEGWFRSSSVANNQTLLASSDIGTATSFFHIYVAATTGRITISTQNAAGQVNTQSGTTNVCNGKWFHWKVNSSGTAWDIDYNGKAEAIIDVAGDNTGDWFADVTLRDNLTIGALVDDGGAQDFGIGVVGWTRIYSRTMAPAEALTNYSLGRNHPASDATGLVASWAMTEANPLDSVGGLTLTATGATLITDNQFYSLDSNRHLMTNLGATWSKYGRDFVAANKDYIEIPASSTQLNFTSEDFSFVFRVNLDAPLTDQALFCRGLLSTDGYELLLRLAGFIDFRTSQGGAFQFSSTAAGTLVAGSWVTLGLSRGGTSVRLYINGVDSTSTAGSHTDPATCTRSFKVGIRDNLTSNAFDGKIGDILVYSRALTAGDHLCFHQVLKWRGES